MRSSYGFQKFLQAIYVVFERATIVTSHDRRAVSACATRPACDASLRSHAHRAEHVRRATRIFIEKNRLFCIAPRWRSLFACFFARAPRAVYNARITPLEDEKTHRKNFRKF